MKNKIRNSKSSVEVSEYRNKTKNSSFVLRDSNFKQSGFTLIEILVALSILAIIGVVAVPNFRQFNTDQEMNNATNDVIRLLQQAQSSAQSQIACINTQPLNTNNPSTHWDFIVVTSKTYQLQADCINAATGNPTSSPVFDNGTLIGPVLSVTYNGATNCSFPANLRFKTLNPSLQDGSGVPMPQPENRIELICAGVTISPLSQVTVNLTQTGFPSKSIQIEANGTVHQ